MPVCAKSVAHITSIVLGPSYLTNPNSGFEGGFIGNSAQSGQVQRQLIINGEAFARYGIASKNDANTAGSATTYQNTLDVSLSAQAFNLPQSDPSTLSASTYTVQKGETLQSIARAVYGDARLWYRLADANSLAVAGDSPLLGGQTLTLPKLGLSANSADSYRPYDPSQTLGNTSPTLPDLPMPQGSGGGCGAMGQIITIAIIAVVTVYTAGAASAYFAGTAQVGFGATMAAGGAALSGAAAGGAALAGAVVGAAAGSTAGQGFAIMAGMQKDFDWSQVATSALSAGVGAGLGQTFGAINAASSGLTVLTRAAIGSALIQGIAEATGLQKEFSWTQVAASAVGAGVGHGMNDALQNVDINPYAKAGLSSFVAGTATAIARGGQVSIQQVAVDTFGQALSSAFVDNMQQPTSKETWGGSLASGNTATNWGAQSGLGEVPELMPVNYSLGAGQLGRINPNEEMDTQRQENLARMMRLANEDSGVAQTATPPDWLTASASPAAALLEPQSWNPSLPSGGYLPSMYAAPQVIARGYTDQGLGYEDWNSGAHATGVRQVNVEATALAPIADEDGGLRYGSIRADQGYWASLGGIAGSDLSFADKAGMVWGTTKYYFRNSNEAQGTVQMLGGGLEVAGAVTLSSTGLGATLGVPLAFHGGDNLGTGFNRFMGNGDGATVMYQSIYSLTGSSTLATAVDQGIPFLAGVPPMSD